MRGQWLNLLRQATSEYAVPLPHPHTCIFPILTQSTIDALLLLLYPFGKPPPPLLPGAPRAPADLQGLLDLDLTAAAVGECVASISSIRMAWLRLLRSFRLVEAVRLAFVPCDTSVATAAAELTGTRSPRPPDRNTPRDGCSRTSILEGGGGGGVVVPSGRGDLLRLLVVPTILGPLPTVSSRLWKVLL